MWRAMLLVLTVLFAGGGAVQAAEVSAGESDLPLLKTKVQTLAVFKNGLGFVYRKGETPLKQGWAEMDAIPAAALGTYWIGTTSPTNPVEEVRSLNKRGTSLRIRGDMADILRANIGKEVTLVYDDGKEVQRDKVTVLDVGYGSGAPSSPLIFVKRQSETGSDILVIERSSIHSVVVPELPEKTEDTTPIPSSKIRIKGNPRNAEVTIAYLQKGFTWAPSYMIDLLSEREAQLTLEAVMANDVEDLEDVDLSFVVGYPSFMFADQMTPLAMQQTVGSFVNSLVTRPPSYMTSPGIPGPPPDLSTRNWRGDNAYSATTAMPGESNEDLYFYRQEHVTLGKGERARFTVLSQKAPVEHIYTYDPLDTMNVDIWGSRRDSGNQNTSVPVWHALRITNTTKQPWTTAPAFVVSGSLPLSQGMLDYTSASAKTTLRLTVAADIQTSQEQTELERGQDTVNRLNVQTVVVGGKITVKNLKTRQVRMSVKKKIVGEVSKADGAKVRKTVDELNAINPNSVLEWEFDLKAGENKELQYTYKVLFR